MNLVIFGSNGPTGRLATARALAAGHCVTAVTRRPHELGMRHPQLTVFGADVHNVSAVRQAIAGADAIVSVLGAAATLRPVNTYSSGTGNIIDAMRASRTRRLIVVSSTAVHHIQRQGVPLLVRVTEAVINKTASKTIHDDMRRMESAVQNSDLDWTIVRPSGLFNLPEPTEYLRGPIDPVGAFTARIDLADYLITLVADTATVRRIVTVSTTQHTPTLWQMARQQAQGVKQ